MRLLHISLIGLGILLVIAGLLFQPISTEETVRFETVCEDEEAQEDCHELMFYKPFQSAVQFALKYISIFVGGVISVLAGFDYLMYERKKEEPEDEF